MNSGEPKTWRNVCWETSRPPNVVLAPVEMMPMSSTSRARLLVRSWTRRVTGPNVVSPWSISSSEKPKPPKPKPPVLNEDLLNLPMREDSEVRGLPEKRPDEELTPAQQRAVEMRRILACQRTLAATKGGKYGRSSDHHRDDGKWSGT